MLIFWLFKVKLFVLHRLTIIVSYLSHSEQMSTDAYEYIDCGVNSTMPHHFPLLWDKTIVNMAMNADVIKIRIGSFQKDAILCYSLLQFI